MNPVETLAQLQEIDRRNRERELEIAELERELGELTAALEQKRAEVEVRRATAAELATRQRELEAALNEAERRIMDRRMRLGRIRNEQEYQAAQREIEANKESNARLTEELLQVLEEAEVVSGDLGAFEKDLEALEARAAEMREQVCRRSGELRAEIGSNRGEREDVASRLSPPVRKKYEQIFARRGGLAVVEIRNGSCQGCNMTLPPQLCIEVRKATGIHLCPSCHRILFWREVAADEVGAG